MEGLESFQLHVGTYSKAVGAGLYPLGEDAAGWSLGKPYAAAPNASFGAFSQRFGLHYLVDEGEEGMLRVLRHGAAGWEPLARVPTQGGLPCYIALDPEERWLAVANYGSGSVALFRLDPRTGLIGDPSALIENSGHGPVADRQDGPHAHCAVFSPDGKWLYQTDLGTDEILAYPIDAERGAGERRVAFAAPAGSGPRHLLFHPHRPLAILVSELASTLTLFDVGDGVLTERQSVSTLPEGFDGESLGGHLGLSPAGDRIYVTNRGHDSIAAFALADEGLSLLGHTPSGGASPRFFLLQDAERRMLVANEEGGNVTVFDVAADGGLTQSGEVAVPGPAFVFATRT